MIVVQVVRLGSQVGVELNESLSALFARNPFE